MSHEFDVSLIMEHSVDNQRTPVEKLQNGITECLKDVKYRTWEFDAFMQQVEVQYLNLDRYRPRQRSYKLPSSSLKELNANIEMRRGRDTGYKRVSEQVETMIEGCRSGLHNGLGAYRKEIPPSIFLDNASDDYLVQATLTIELDKIKNKELEKSLAEVHW